MPLLHRCCDPAWRGQEFHTLVRLILESQYTQASADVHEGANPNPALADCVVQPARL